MEGKGKSRLERSNGELGKILNRHFKLLGAIKV